MKQYNLQTFMLQKYVYLSNHYVQVNYKTYCVI